MEQQSVQNRIAEGSDELPGSVFVAEEVTWPGVMLVVLMNIHNICKSIDIQILVCFLYESDIY